MGLKLIFIIVLLLCPGLSKTQQHDNIWLFGYESYTNTDGWGGSVLDFSGDSLEVYYEYRDMNLDITNASICDTAGNLLFYTNGIYIANALHEPMENGEGLNPGEYADDNFWYGYILIQGAIILPNPNNEDEFYILHMLYENPSVNMSYHGSRVLYSKIDMSFNNGLGKVIEKNIVVFEDILDHGKMTAVKHANGRDWWILVSKYEGNGYHKILLKPDVVEYAGLQSIGSKMPDGIGQAVFSPAGGKYVHYNQVSISSGSYINIYDFDRCTGELSNPIQDILIDSAYAGGVAISPNSRYLYVSSFNYIYQYDLEATDVLATKDTVAIYDGYEVEVSAQNNVYLPTRFFMMQSGPDGKIYINCPGSPNVLHVINQPDSAGMTCGVLQHHIELPTYNNSSLPNFPNYRLSALEGSGCDTITSVEDPIAPSNGLSVFPNPANGYVNLSFKEYLPEEVMLNIYSITGQQLIKVALKNEKKEHTVDVSTLNPGIYFFNFNSKSNSILLSGKFSIIK